MSARIQELESKLEELESKLYDDTAYEGAIDLCMEAERLLDSVLDHFGLTYFCPGEPVAEGTQRDGSEIVIPLSGHNADMLTDEEEEQVLATNGEFEIHEDIYWARLRTQQARDILDEGWQYGLLYEDEEEMIS